MLMIVIDLVFDIIRLNFSLILVLFGSTPLIISKIRQINLKKTSIILFHVLNIIALVPAIISLEDSVNVFTIIGIIVASIATVCSGVKLTEYFLEFIGK